MRTLLLLALLATCLAASSAELVVCYFVSWATYRPGNGKFEVENLDAHLCTHAIFAFAGLNGLDSTIQVLDPWNENCPSDNPPGGKCAFDRAVALKLENPALKVLLSVGGYNEGSVDYSMMAANSVKRKSFIDSTVVLLLEHGFDGMDLAWQYPTQRGGTPADKENYVILLDEFRTEFDKHDLLLTVAVSATKSIIDAAYDVKGMSKSLDFINVMSYDFHGVWEKKTNHASPLCGHHSSVGDYVFANVVFSINYWLELGAPKEKIVMGIPSYGRCFTLDDINENDIQSPASHPGTAGPYTREAGLLGYNEICLRLKDETDCTVVHDPSMFEPYMYCKKDNIWCGYEDAKSVEIKTRFAKNIGIGGVMTWSADTDDFMPSCGEGPFPLINAIKRALVLPSDGAAEECSAAQTTTIGGSTPTTPSGGTTLIPTWPTAPNCSLDSDRLFYPHEDCNKYWYCSESGDAAMMLQCPFGAVFDPITSVCLPPANVDTSHCKME